MLHVTNEFGRQLTEARQRHGLKQGQVCVLVNGILGISPPNRGCLTQPTLSAWETGRQCPSNSKRAILHALGEVFNREVDFERLAADGITLENSERDDWGDILKQMGCTDSGPETVRAFMVGRGLLQGETRMVMIPTSESEGGIWLVRTPGCALICKAKHIQNLLQILGKL